MTRADPLREHLAELDFRRLADDVAPERVGAYHGYGEQCERLCALAERGARVERAGLSVCANPIFSVAIGPARARATSVILAGLHPIEWIGVETAFALLERLLDHPPGDRAVLVLPLINVDGYRLVESDLRAGRRRWRRGNHNRVDLNRNFPTHFKAGGAITGRLLDGYNHGGPFPLSEPEIAAVVATLDRVDATSRIDIALSLHSTGRMLLTPYGGIWRAPADAPRLQAAARAIQRRLPEPYGIKQSSRWVPGAFARGMELDHLHARYGATAILVECGLGALRVRDPSSYTQPFRWFNPRDPERVASYLCDALEPFVRGQLG